MGVIVMLAALPAASRAQEGDPVDRAEQAHLAADFAASMAALDEAMAHELDREALVRALTLRLFNFFALQNTLETESAARALARVGPATIAGVSPALADIYARARRQCPPVRVDAEAYFSDHVAQIEGHASGTAPLVSRVEVHARIPGGAWTTTRDAVRLEAGAALAVEYWVEVVGPGGAVLVSEGSASSPLVLTRREALASVAPSDDDIPWWPFVLGGVLIAAGAGVGIGIAFSMSQPSGVVLLGPTSVDGLGE